MRRLFAVVGLGFLLSACDNPTLRWDRTLGAERFVVLAKFGNAAVLDYETGLVWEKSPATTTQSWADAKSGCSNKAVGGRRGWRLPSLPDLTSLVDPNNPTGNPDLPPGHPFSDVQASNYWTHQSVPGTAYAWMVDFGTGIASTSDPTLSHYAWCVRGPMNAAIY